MAGSAAVVSLVHRFHIRKKGVVVFGTFPQKGRLRPPESRLIIRPPYYSIVSSVFHRPLLDVSAFIRGTIDKQWQKSDHLLLGNKIIGRQCVAWGIILVISRGPDPTEIFPRASLCRATSDYIIIRSMYTRAWFLRPR